MPKDRWELGAVLKIGEMSHAQYLYMARWQKQKTSAGIGYVDLQGPVAVHAKISQLFSHHGRKDDDLILPPVEPLLEKAHGHTLKVVEQVVLLPHAEQLHTLVPGPRRAGQLEHLLGDIIEAAVLKPSFPTRRVVHRCTKLDACCTQII